MPTPAPLLRPAPHEVIRQHRGDSWNLRIPIVLPTGEPKNLTSAVSIRYMWRQRHANGTEALSYNLADDPSVIELEQPPPGDPVQYPNVILIQLPLAVLDDLAEGAYYDELEIIDAGFNRRTPWWGPVHLIPDAIRASAP